MEQNVSETPLLLHTWAWIEKNRKLVIIGVVALGVIVAAVAYSNWASRQKRIAAGQAVSQAAFAMENRQNGQSPAQALLQVAAAHSGSDAGAQALLLAANEQFNRSNYAEAHSTFERFISDYGTHRQIAQALYGSGTALAAQGKLDEAVPRYKECVERYSTSPIAVYAKFSLARAYEKQGKSDLALSLYQEILREGQGRSVMNEAAERVEALMPAVISTTEASTPAETTNAPAAQP